MIFASEFHFFPPQGKNDFHFQNFIFPPPREKWISLCEFHFFPWCCQGAVSFAKACTAKADSFLNMPHCVWSCFFISTCLLLLFFCRSCSLVCSSCSLFGSCSLFFLFVGLFVPQTAAGRIQPPQLGKTHVKTVKKTGCIGLYWGVIGFFSSLSFWGAGGTWWHGPSTC